MGDTRPWPSVLMSEYKVKPLPADAHHLTVYVEETIRARRHVSSGMARCAALIAAFCGRWARTQGVYAFDEDFAREVSSSDDLFLSELFRRLPAPCVWIDTPWNNVPGTWFGDGFYGAFVTTHEHMGEPFVSVCVCGSNMHLTSHVGERTPGEPLPLANADFRLDGTLFESIEEGKANHEARRSSIASEDTLCTSDANARKYYGEILSMAMYLCSEEPDITHKPSPMNQARMRRGKTPYHPTIHHVGYRIGAAFRKAKEEREASQGIGGTGASPAPHMRRAHWHTYWVGARGTEQRRQVVKWLPPIPVNVTSDDDIIPVIRKVTKE